MAIVPPPTGDPDAPLGVLTGSEDGTVLRAVYTRERVARSPGEVGQHFAGAGVRAVRVVPERPGGGLAGASPASKTLRVRRRPPTSSSPRARRR